MRSVSHRTSWLLLAGLALLSLYLGQPRSAQSSQSPGGPLASTDVLRKIEPELLRQLLDHPDDSHRFIVEMRDMPRLPTIETGSRAEALARRQAIVQTLRSAADRSQAGITALLSVEQQAGRASRVQRFWIFNGLAVTAQSATALAIADRADVRAVRLDRMYLLPAPKGTGKTPMSTSAVGTEWNLQKVGADRVWNSLKIDGAGVVIGSMDTGVDWRHPALQASYRGNVGKGVVDHGPNWLCATDEGYQEPTDVYGHGTHTVGTMVGRTPDHSIGMAPGAKWIAAKIFKNDGSSYASWIHAGFQWMLDPGGEGDPALAPDIVNNSWGSILGDDVTFQPDVQAWRAAGIVPVFAAGNDGPFTWTVNSPGSFPESIAVGATDRRDDIAAFSGRGPTGWNETKPEIVAPGYEILSCLPYDQYGIYNGTSMATPHVSGLAALLLQANHTLGINEIENLLTSSAVHLGRTWPNNDSGWGRIDAYRAATAAAHPGNLGGAVRRFIDNRPVSGARITAAGLLPEQGSGHAESDSGGKYAIPLAAWTYDVSVSAFGYYPKTASAIPVVSGTQTVRDFSLSALPSGVIHGFVRELNTGTPLSATVSVSGTPVTAVSLSSTGEYSVELPAGTYTVEARRLGHRVGRAAGVVVTAGQTRQLNFSLRPAPTILVVDSAVWYNQGKAAYFSAALEALDYVHVVRPIRFLYGDARDVPTAAELARYDVVIWSAANDSPGYADAWPAIRSYLDGGGKLLLTGQNIGYWDGSGGQFSSAEYDTYLHVQFDRDDAGFRALQGLPGELLAGMALTLNGSESADNQDSPDAVSSSDPARSTVVAQYDPANDAVLHTGACETYRVVYLAFGFEGIHQASTRRDVMERIMNWFGASNPTVRAVLTPLQQTAIQAPGGPVTYSLQVHNSGGSGQADSYTLGLSPHTWPSQLSRNTVTVANCGVTTFTVRVDIPSYVPRDVFEALTVTARSTLSPTLTASAVISTESAAPILLVDRDRWYDQEAAYRRALEANGLPYDYWNVGWTAAPAQGSPSAERLSMYPIVIWFTGYDWSGPVSAADEHALSTALDSGTRLLLCSQDYLYARGLNSFGRDYLGIGNFTADVTTTQAIGNQGDPIGNLLGPYDLDYPFPDRSDLVYPVDGVSSAFRGDLDEPVAVRHLGTGFRSTFFGFPIEAIPDAGREQVIRQAVGWLSWLGRSTLAASATQVQPGATIAYTMTVVNDGPQSATATLTDDLPAELEPVTGSVFPAGASYDPTTRRLAWTGLLLGGGSAVVGLRVILDPTISGTYAITHTASIGYLEHQVQFERSHVLLTGAPDMSASSVSASPAAVQPGAVLTYTIGLVNRGLGIAASAYLTDPIPSGTEYVTGSVRLVGAGTVSELPGEVRWDGPIAPGELATVTFQVRVETAQWGSLIRNAAHLSDGLGSVRRLRVSTPVALLNYYLPQVPKRGKP